MERDQGEEVPVSVDVAVDEDVDSVKPLDSDICFDTASTVDTYEPTKQRAILRCRGGEGKYHTHRRYNNIMQYSSESSHRLRGEMKQATSIMSSTTTC